MNNRWDWAWKEFLDPGDENVSKWFIKHLLDERYVNMKIDIAKLEAVATEGHSPGGVQVADMFIKVTVDKEHNTLHFEFQSTADDKICLRMLEYGLQHAERQGKCGNDESYSLPFSMLVNVRPTSQSGGASRSYRQLTLNIGGQSVRVCYPTVEGYDVVPGLSDIMFATDEDTRDESILRFLRRLPRPSDSMKSDRLAKACFVISYREGYSAEGIPERRLEQMSQRVGHVETNGEYWDRKTVLAVVAAAKELSKETSIPFEDAKIRILESVLQSGDDLSQEVISAIKKFRLSD